MLPTVDSGFVHRTFHHRGRHLPSTVAGSVAATAAIIVTLFVGPASAERSRGAVARPTTSTLREHVSAPGLYQLRLEVVPPPGARHDSVEVFVQSQQRRLVLTRTSTSIGMRVRLRRPVLTVRVVANGGRPRLLARVSSVGPIHTSRSGVATNANQPIAFGAYVSGVPDYPSLLDQFSSLVGRRPSIVLWYRYWTEQPFATQDLQEVDSRGEVPMVTWEPWTPDHTGILLAAIARGDYDSLIAANARAAAAWGKPIFVRFAQEMNGDWFPWGLGVGGNTASEFVAAWRHIVDVFRAQGAGNVRWVWTPNEMDSGTPGFQSLYPGNAYVDWVGIDGYNFGDTAGNTWQSFTQVFSASYRAMLALTSKPMMITETASVEQGGHKAAWITSALGSELPGRFPRVRALVWFDQPIGDQDWRVDSSTASLAAFRGAIDSSRYGVSASSLLAIPTS